MPDSQAEERRALISWIRSPVVWLGAVDLVLGAYLYFPFFFPGNHRELVTQGEAFFFQASEAAGAPVLVLSVWLFYRRSHLRDVLNGPGRPLLASLVFFACAEIFGWGAYTAAADIQLMTAIGLLVGVVLLFGGLAGLHAYWLPILFLGFALPISPVFLAAVIYPIQLATAEYAGLILNGIGVASIVQGDQILRPENSFIVIETCSGIRTVVTLTMLTILLIDLFERRGLHAAVLIVLAPIVAFLTNGFRVVSLVLNPHSSVHSIHNLQGIAMLLVGLTAMYLIDGGLERVLGSRDANREEGDYGLTHGDASSLNRRVVSLVAVAFLLVAMLSVDGLLPKWSLPASQDEKAGDLLARIFGEDPRAPYPIDYNFIGSVHYLDQARHRVVVDGGIVEVHLGVANEQLRGYSILTKRLAWPASGYAPKTEAYEEIVAGGPVARRMLLRRGSRTVLSYSWIKGRRSFPVEWFRKAAALDRSLFVRPQHMLAIRLSTTLGSGASAEGDAERRIGRVWEQLEPELAGYAPIRAWR